MAWGMGAMAQQVCVVLSAAEREQLAAIVADRNRPRKHVERAGIVTQFLFLMTGSPDPQNEFPGIKR